MLRKGRGGVARSAVPPGGEPTRIGDMGQEALMVVHSLFELSLVLSQGLSSHEGRPIGGAVGVKREKLAPGFVAMNRPRHLKDGDQLSYRRVPQRGRSHERLVAEATSVPRFAPQSCEAHPKSSRFEYELSGVKSDACLDADGVHGDVGALAEAGRCGGGNRANHAARTADRDRDRIQAVTAGAGPELSPREGGCWDSHRVCWPADAAGIGDDGKTIGVGNSAKACGGSTRRPPRRCRRRA